MAALASLDGRSLANFKVDPIESVQYSIGMEQNKDGRQIAAKVHDHYFNQVTKKEDIVKQYGQMMSDYAFFKCIDDLVSVRSQLNNLNTFYYYYNHKSELSLLRLYGISPDDKNFGTEIFDIF